MPRKPPRKTTKAKERPPLQKNDDGVVLLSGGNPQIAKADGDAPVQAYIAAMPEWKSDIGRQLDDLIVRTVPGVRKAVRWNSPFYGVEGQGWFLSYHVFSPLREGDLPQRLVSRPSASRSSPRTKTRATTTFSRTGLRTRNSLRAGFVRPPPFPAGPDSEPPRGCASPLRRVSSRWIPERPGPCKVTSTAGVHSS